ncbi:MAG: secretin N-terminal domain-containing protein [Nitrospirota bacterium]
MIHRLLSVLILFLILSSCAPKQVSRPEETVPAVSPEAEELKLPEFVPKTEVKEEKKPEKPVSEKKAEEQYIMLNFENADIETVVSTIAEMLKINYILAPGVSGKITVQSSNKIPLSELFPTFQTLLEFNGFTAVKDGSFYRIVPIDTAKQQPVPVESGKTPSVPKDSSFVTQGIPLEYVKANDVANIVRNLMPRGTDIIVYEPANTLFVTAPPAGIIKLMKILEFIDIPATERDSIRTFVYHVENGEAKKLADILKNIYKKAEGVPPSVKSVTTAPVPAPRTPPRVTARPQPATGATVQEGLAGEIEGEIVIEAYEDINALIIKTTPRGYVTLLETIKKLDVQPKQVLIEVLIAEITLDDTTKLGIEWLLKTSIHAEGKDFDVLGGFAQKPTDFITTEKDTTSGEIIIKSTDFVPVVASGLFANVIAPNKINALIYAAATNDKINVLASPHILALDNKEAKIEIADEVPVATSISQPQTSTDYSTSQVQFKSAGTILTVTPHINENKQVTLKITQEVSELGGKVPIADQEYQGFKTRKANTTAIVQDGHTLVLGGIITERMQKTRSGIPFLSKIPVLGYLFGTTTDSVAKKELVLMVTPHVVANHEEADALTREFQNKVKDLKKKIEEKNRKNISDPEKEKERKEE